MGKVIWTTYEETGESMLSEGSVISSARRTTDLKNPSEPVPQNSPQVTEETQPAHSAQNTTIGVVATNARLTKAQANRLATVCHDGAIRRAPSRKPM